MRRRATCWMLEEVEHLVIYDPGHGACVTVCCTNKFKGEESFKLAADAGVPSPHGQGRDTWIVY